MNKEEILHDFCEYMTRRSQERKWTIEVVCDLVKMGVMKHNLMLIVLVKRDFEELLQSTKGKRKSESIKLDIAAKYNITKSFVNKAIYYRDKIKI